jgi:hypothetical protein
MAEIVQGLFGVSPELFKQQQDLQFRAQALAEAKLDPEQGMIYDAAIRGRNIGRTIGGLLGAEDPMLARQSKENNVLQEVQSSLSPEDMQDPYKLSAAVYQAAMQANLPELANNAFQNMQVAQSQAIAQGKDISQTALNIQKATAETKTAKTTVEKLYDAWDESKNNPQKAKVIKEALDKEVRSDPKLSSKAQELIDAGYVYGTDSFNTKMKEYIQSDITGKAKGQGVNIGGITIDTGKASEEAGKIVGTEVAKVQEQYAAIDDFVNAKNLLAKGIFTGPYANKEMAVAKYTRQNLTKVANTEEFKTSIANNVIKRLKDIGGNDTKEERDYLESMLAGDITLEPTAIKAVLNSAENKIRDKLDRLKLQAEAAEKGKKAPIEALPKSKIKSPATASEYFGDN